MLGKIIRIAVGVVILIGAYLIYQDIQIKWVWILIIGALVGGALIISAFVVKTEKENRGEEKPEETEE